MNGAISWDLGDLSVPNPLCESGLQREFLDDSPDPEEKCCLRERESMG
jgi:hypothetical protein